MAFHLSTPSKVLECAKFVFKFVAWPNCPYLYIHLSFPPHCCSSRMMSRSSKGSKRWNSMPFNFLCVGFLWTTLFLTWRLHLKSDLRDSFLMKCNKASNNLLGQLLAKLPVYPFWKWAPLSKQHFWTIIFFRSVVPSFYCFRIAEYACWIVKRQRFSLSAHMRTQKGM